MVDNVLSQPEGKRLMLLVPITKSVKANTTPNAGKSGKPGYIPRLVLTAKSAILPGSAEAGAAKETYH